MSCEICKVNKAIIHITEIENGIVKEIHLCQECAESGEASKLSQGFVQFGFSSIPKEIAKIKCNFCGSTLVDISKKRLLGCYNDYNVFRKFLVPIIEKIHSAKRHTGKIPIDRGGKNYNILVQIKELEIQLKEAIKKEEFEKAAEIRDKIKELKDLSEKNE